MAHFSRFAAQDPQLMARGSWLPKVRGSWFLKVRGSWLLMAQWFMARGFSRLVAHFSRLVYCSGFCDPAEAEKPT